jgi:hypothetical protein
MVCRDAICQTDEKFGVRTETVRIGDRTKVLNLSQKTQNPVVGKLLLSEAETKLKKGLKNLKSIAKKMPPLKKSPVRTTPSFSFPR